MASQSATTFKVSGNKPEIFLSNRNYSIEPSLLSSLQSSYLFQQNHCTEILQISNFPSRSFYDDTVDNGFVKTVLRCYNNHYNLVIRPDDVWAAIMTQFSFYVNKHAEEFRGKFVDFEGKKELEVTIDGVLRNAPYDLFVKLMSKEIDKNLVDPEVKKWILPSFSTTTDNDLVVAGVVFMASMKKYFDYKVFLRCGIPNVTLEGTVEDWKEILRRLDKLKEYKLDKWYNLLKPVLIQFVKAKEGKVSRNFWQKICHHDGGGSGPRYISGWITVFCVFDKDGNWQESNKRGRLLPLLPTLGPSWIRLDTNDIPPGIVEVDVTIVEAKTYHSVLFAGHMAAEVKEDGCTLQPSLGWAIALKPEPEDFSSKQI